MSGLEQALQSMGELLSYVGLVALILAIGLAASPLVLWWNTAKNNRLLRELIEQQERTNELLEKLAGEQDEFIISEDK